MTEQTSAPVRRRTLPPDSPGPAPAQQPSSIQASSAQLSHAPSPLDMAVRAAHRDTPQAPAPGEAPAVAGAYGQSMTPEKAVYDKTAQDKKIRARVTGAQSLVLP